MASFADMSKIIMNPVRMRIVQYLLLHERGTAANIGDELSDVPKASLYRHMKVLESAGMLIIVQENKKRGTVEKVYELNKQPFGAEKPDNEDLNGLVHGMLLGIMGDFQRYLKSGDADPERDMYAISSSTLLLTDEEFQALLSKVGEVFNEVLDNKPGGGRKVRRLTWISSPTDGREEEKEEK